MTTQKIQSVIIEDGAVYVIEAGTTIFIKTADVCAMTGKSNQWIGQLVSQGMLHKRTTKYGSFFDLSSTIRSYCDNLEARVKPEDKTEKEKNEADVSIKKAKAIRAVLEAKELQGKMHRSEDVRAITEDFIYAVRGILTALPGRLAVDVAKAKDAAEASEIIRAEVHKAMRELSEYTYDPKKYEERVRGRLDWESEKSGRDDDGEQ